MELNIRAYAKLNLWLEIGDKLENGYHLISSAFQAIDLYDSISISRLDDGYHLLGTKVCADSENLATKAKTMLESEFKTAFPCSIRLIKSIPVAAGLGGGSSNAAAVLVGLNQLYSLRLSADELADIGSKVGSDVPFFVYNHGSALVEGLGDIVTPSNGPSHRYFLLARPHVRVSTAEMYALHDESGLGFAEIAKQRYPLVEVLLDVLSKSSDLVGMSGSGPTIFAGYPNYDAASAASERLMFDGDIYLTCAVDTTFEIEEKLQ
jgi:4-diphosphocytidyl-2-C-methyl-D-erythritol kinase